MPEAVATKSCTVCGIDCSGRPRVKDQQGRYMCQECFDKVKQTKQVQKAPPAPAVAAVTAADPAINLNDNSFLLDIGGSKSTSVTGASKVCPECGRGMSASAVVCIGCGFNSQTGKRLALKVEKAKKTKVESGGGDAAELGSYAMLCIIGGLVGGAVGTGIWTAVAHFAQLEVSYVALAVGGLSGAGCAMGAKGYAGFMSGVLASAIALAAIIAGKYFSGLMILQKLGYADAPVDVWLPHMFSFFDVLWFALAVAAAFKVGSADIGD